VKSGAFGTGSWTDTPGALAPCSGFYLRVRRVVPRPSATPGGSPRWLGPPGSRGKIRRWVISGVLLVLDEPTAALDAETEHALFERYAAAARGTGEGDSGRITILVSHRFSTVRMADLIVVLDGARLVEVGTLDDLMAKKGQYAELYSIQAAAYR
jgi:ABC-type phosphonate transport system ATPase subunit